jgi:hypothetical protein
MVVAPLSQVLNQHRGLSSLPSFCNTAIILVIDDGAPRGRVVRPDVF